MTHFCDVIIITYQKRHQNNVTIFFIFGPLSKFLATLVFHWIVDWQKFYCRKNSRNFSNTIQKNSPENSLPLPKNRHKTKMILLRRDVMTKFTHSYKLIHLTTYGFSNIEVRRILNLVRRNYMVIDLDF